MYDKFGETKPLDNFDELGDDLSLADQLQSDLGSTNTLLEDFKRRRSRTVGIMGFPKAGKTSYLIALVTKIRSTLTASSWEIINARDELLDVRRRLIKLANEPLESTPRFEAPEAIDLFSMRKWWTHLDISSGDTSGEHFGEMAGLEEPTAEKNVSKYVNELADEVLPYCPGYILMVDCSLTREQMAMEVTGFEAIFNRMHGHGSIESTKAKRKLRSLRKNRPRAVAVAFTKVDKIMGKTVTAPRDLSRYYRYLHENNETTSNLIKSNSDGTISYVIDRDILLDENKHPDEQEVEAIVRDYIYSTFSDSLGAWILKMERSDDYQVRVFPVSAWGKDLLKKDGKNILPEIEDIPAHRVLEPVVWIADCMFVSKWKRIRKRVRNWMAVFIMMMFALLPLFKFSVQTSKEALAEGNIGRACFWSTLAYYNPYCDFLHWFHPEALYALGLHNDALMRILIDQDRLSESLSLHERRNWILGQVGTTWFVNEIEKRIGIYYARGDFEEAKQYAKAFFEDIAPSERFPETLEKTVDILCSEYEDNSLKQNVQVKSFSQNLTFDELVTILDKKAQKQPLPKVCQLLIAEAKCRRMLTDLPNSYPEVDINGQLDSRWLENAFQGYMDACRECCKAGDPNLLPQARAKLRKIAHSYAEAISLRRQLMIKEIGEKSRSPDAKYEEIWQTIRHLIEQYENVERKVPEALKSYPEVMNELQRFNDEQADVELHRTRALLKYAESKPNYDAKLIIKQGFQYWMGSTSVLGKLETKELEEIISGTVELYLKGTSDTKWNIVASVCEQAAQVPALTKFIAKLIPSVELRRTIGLFESVTTMPPTRALSAIKEALAYWQQNTPNNEQAKQLKTTILHVAKQLEDDWIRDLLLDQAEKIQPLKNIVRITKSEFMVAQICELMVAGKLDQAIPLVQKLRTLAAGQKFEELCNAVLEFDDTIKKLELVYVPTAGIGIDPFYISRYEVTIEEYREFLRYLGDQEEKERHWPRFKTYSQDLARMPDEEADILSAESNLYCNDYKHKSDELFALSPVTGVSLWDAEAYCDFLTKKHHVRFRIPTVDEWELAAGNRTYPWGTKQPNSVILERRWLVNPVGFRISDKSELGCFDMGNNVREWTFTCENSDEYIVKGCSFDYCDVTNPEYYSNFETNCRDNSERPYTRKKCLGFRTACDFVPEGWWVEELETLKKPKSESAH